MRKIKGTAAIKKLMQAAPVIMIIVCIFIYFRFFRGVTIAHILEFTPTTFGLRHW